MSPRYPKIILADSPFRSPVFTVAGRSYVDRQCWACLQIKRVEAQKILSATRDGTYTGLCARCWGRYGDKRHVITAAGV